MTLKKSEKKDILELMENMRMLQKMLVDSDEELLTDYLLTCQQAAISVGDILEKNSPDGLQDMIGMLEQYAECCYELSVRGECETEDVKQLDDLLEAVTDKIKKISVKIQIAFFPYKAEMWDSLESIYMAAAADPDCEAKVIPIPYYEMDQTVGKWVLKYDGGHFPLGIPIEFYKEYDVKTEQPDIAYIHNPYDNYNLITSVHPDYYSFELKKHVGKLVYVPYYVNAGTLSDRHKNLPCYRHVDYIILQSKQAKEECRGMLWYDKMLALGSPKIDRVVRKCKEGVNIPENWERVIKGRRTLMLNSTLEELFKNNENIFIKLMNFFKFIRTDKNIAVIWRPHPLYEATIRAMRPELLQPYTDLKNFFVNNDIGVLDTTPDISSTVAVADGYIGSPCSSVINLFGAAGKPIFLFDDTVTDILPGEESGIISFDSCCLVGDRIYAYSYYPDYLFEISLQDDMGSDNPLIKPIANVSNDKLYMCPYWSMEALLGKLYFVPTGASELAQYDPECGKVKNIYADKNFDEISFSGIQICADSVFLVKPKYDLMAEYNVRKHKWIYHTRELELLFENSGLDQNARIMGRASYGRTIYFSTGVTNRILKIFAGTGEFEIITIGVSNVTTDIPVHILGASAEGIWLEILNNIYRRQGAAGIYLAPWDSLNSIEDWKYFPLIVGKYDTNEDMPQAKVFTKAYDVGGYMVVRQSRGEHIFRINRKSGEISLLAEGFRELRPERGSKKIRAGKTIKVAAASESHLLIQRSSDNRMALINVADNTFTEFIPRLSDNDFNSILKGNDGFRKDGRDGYFAMRETSIYSMQYFLKQFAETGWEEIKERQMAALESFAANLDGSCGEKVHRTVVQKVKNGV